MTRRANSLPVSWSDSLPQHPQARREGLAAVVTLGRPSQAPLRVSCRTCNVLFSCGHIRRLLAAAWQGKLQLNHKRICVGSRKKNLLQFLGRLALMHLQRFSVDLDLFFSYPNHVHECEINLHPPVPKRLTLIRHDQRSRNLVAARATAGWKETTDIIWKKKYFTIKTIKLWDVPRDKAVSILGSFGSTTG